MSTPIIYKSSDASAPVLRGVVGDITTLLDAILVNGYGSKAAAGWTKSYTGTNLASYRQPANHQFYLDVNDNASGGSGAKEAVVRGYESMTAIATGTNAFPTTGQESAGLRIRKSNTADTTVRPWVAVADDRTLILATKTGDSGNDYCFFYFGDFYSFQASDGYNVGLFCGQTNHGPGGNDFWTTSNLDQPGQRGFVAVAGYVARSYTASVGAVPVTHEQNSNNSSVWTTTLDNAVWVRRYMLWETNPNPSVLRGFLRGLWVVVGLNVNDGDDFSGAVSSALAGRSWYVIKSLAAATSQPMAVETTAFDTST